MKLRDPKNIKNRDTWHNLPEADRPTAYLETWLLGKALYDRDGDYRHRQVREALDHLTDATPADMLNDEQYRAESLYHYLRHTAHNLH